MSAFSSALEGDISLAARANTRSIMSGRRNIDLVPARSTIRMSRRFSLVIIENVLWHYRAVDEALQVPRQRRDMLHPLHDYLLLLPFALPRLTAGYCPLQTL